MKRIVVLCDGTWNSADAKHPTNVVKLWKALDEKDADGNPQVSVYDAGVGSKGGWARRVFEGATGAGLSRNIRDVYMGLVDAFEPGDKIYLFGFSRGAYSVRSLAGMIRNCGIVRKPADSEQEAELVKKAFKLYRSHAEGDHPNGENARTFRKTYSEETNITFIGVWDTVGALGNPLWSNSPLTRMNKFHDTSLSRIIENAYHAMSIDEKRLNFKACLWDQQQSLRDSQVLEQVWFAGVHADVGGGYADTTFSDLPLAWMMEKAQSCGLAFKTDPPVLKPLLGKQPHESWKLFYKLIPPNIRSVRLNGTTNDIIHDTAAEKYRKDRTYKPKNLIPPLG